MARIRTKKDIEEIINLVTSRKTSAQHKLEALKRSQERPYELGSAEAATLFFQNRPDDTMDEILLSYVTIIDQERNPKTTHAAQALASNESWQHKAKKLDSIISGTDAASLSRAENAYLQETTQKLLKSKAKNTKANRKLKKSLERHSEDADRKARQNFPQAETAYDILADNIRGASRSSNTLRDLTRAYSETDDKDLIRDSILETGKNTLSRNPWNERLFMIEDALPQTGTEQGTEDLNEHEALYLAHIASSIRKNKSLADNVFLKPRRDRIVKSISRMIGKEYEQYNRKATRLHDIRDQIEELASMDFPYSVHEETETLMRSYDQLKQELLSEAPFFEHKDIEKTCREIESHRDRITQDFEQAYDRYQVELDSMYTLQEVFNQLSRSESGVRAMELAETLLPSYESIKKRVLERAPADETDEVMRSIRSVENSFSRILEKELEDRQPYNQALSRITELKDLLNHLSESEGGSGAYEKARALVREYRQSKQHALQKAPYSDQEMITSACTSIDSSLDRIVTKEKDHRTQKAEQERKQATANLCKLHRRFTQLKNMEGGEGASEEATLLLSTSYKRLKQRSLQNAPEESGRKIDLLCRSIENTYHQIIRKEEDYSREMSRRQKESVQIDPEVFIARGRTRKPVEETIPLMTMQEGIDLPYIDEKVSMLGGMARKLSSAMAAALFMLLALGPNKTGNAVIPPQERDNLTPAQIEREIESYAEEQTGMCVDPAVAAILEKEKKQKEKKEYINRIANRTEFADIKLHDEYLPDIDSLDQLTEAYTEKMRKRFPHKTAYLEGTDLPVKYSKVAGKIVPFILRDGISVTSHYGQRINPFIRRSNRQPCHEGAESVEQNGKTMICHVFHWGTDIVTTTNSDIYALTPGVVTEVSYNPKTGHSLEYVSHLSNGARLEIKYVHLKEPPKHFKEGDRVSPFDSKPLAQYGGEWTGTTGDHIHLEIRVKDRKGNAKWVNPAHYLPISKGIALAQHIRHYNHNKDPGKDEGMQLAQKDEEKECVGSSKTEYMPED